MEPNQRIGDYEILGELGRGGMGKVYKVRNVISDRVDAMKVLLPDLVGCQDLAARFLREIKVLAALNHPNIAALRTALTADNQLVMIMEFVEGQTLSQRLKHGPIATADAISYIDQVLQALEFAHKQHVVHRDIKPANMMLTPSGVVKLMDFGIARAQGDQTLTAADTTTGSLGYMSPEQVHGTATDGRSDLYSVGISLYQMVTGQLPFQADSNFAVMLAHLNEQPKPPIDLQPGLPAGLNDIILKAMAKDPAARFQSADEFRQALKSLGVARQAASRTATLVGTAVIPATAPTVGAVMPAAARMPTPGTGSDHARTMLDTKTPSVSPLAAPHVAAAAQGPAPARSGFGHPFMFVALGGVLVVGALVGTGLYLGRAEADPGRSSATEAPATAATTTPAPAPAPDTAVTPTPAAASPAIPQETPPVAPPAAAVAGQPAASVAPAATNDRATVTTPRSSADGAPRALAVESGAAAKSSAATAARVAAPSAPSAAVRTPAPKAGAKPSETTQNEPPALDRLDKLEVEIDQLTSRAEAVNSSLDRMQQQQARQGLALRGDMASRQSSMRLNLSKAQEAVNARDVARAQRYRDAVEADIEALERFLGR
jgi:eukaryotic-like serine/threonine-protein kinase